MNHPIYFIVSFVIGISIILLFVQLNTFTSDSNIEALNEEILLRNFMTTQEIIEYHLKKIGFRASSNPIVEADSSRIKFICDDDRNNQLDELELTTKNEISNTENPNDFGLVLIRNGEEQVITPANVTKFVLEYFDVNGNPTNEKMFIKSIKVTLRMETENRIKGHYLFFENQFIVKPKNLV